MTRLCGADGCRDGWVAITEDLETGALQWHVAPSISALVTEEPRLDLIAIDVPIGLLEVGKRACDVAARALLGRGRRSSVFPTPIRAVLDARSRDEACRVWERKENKRMQIQTWSIMPKIVEVDDVLRGAPDLRPRVREVHPEVCFYYLADGRPMSYKKTKSAGKSERLKLLTAVFGLKVQEALAHRQQLGCEAHDVLDGFVALWTARRVWAGTAITLPTTPGRDSYGLSMEMVA